MFNLKNIFKKEKPINECLPNSLLRDLVNESIISEEEYYNYYENYLGTEDITLDNEEVSS